MTSYIQSSELVQLLQGYKVTGWRHRYAPYRSKLAVIDVRDEDYEGGHIAGSLHFPSQELLLEGGVEGLARQLPAEARLVVLHCQLSQIRGPKCASRLVQYMKSNPNAEWPEVKVLSRGYEGFLEVSLKLQIPVHARTAAQDTAYGGRPELFESLR